MTAYKYFIVYDTLFFDPSPLVGVFLFGLLVFGSIRTWKRSASSGKIVKVWSRVLAGICLPIAVIGVSAMLINLVTSYVLYKEAHSKPLRTAEGKISGLKPMEPKGDEMTDGHFCAGKSCFDYFDWEMNLKLHEGDQARVTYGRALDRKGIPTKKVYLLEIAQP